MAGVVVGKQLGKIVEERAIRKKAEQACAEALQEWLVALIGDFKECGVDEDDLQRFFPDHIGAINRFLQDEGVSTELLRPFTDPVPDCALRSRLLIDRWQALSLPALPAGFNAERACRSYVERLNQMRQAIEVLRPLWQAQAGQRRIELLQHIRGQWADWDLDRYADAVRETYQALAGRCGIRPGLDSAPAGFGSRRRCVADSRGSGRLPSVRTSTAFCHAAPLAGANPLHPDLMTSDERLTELARILASGLLRLRRQSPSNSSVLRDFRLDFSPARSVHATTGKRRTVAR